MAPAVETVTASTGNENISDNAKQSTVGIIYPPPEVRSKPVILFFR